MVVDGRWCLVSYDDMAGWAVLDEAADVLEGAGLGWVWGVCGRRCCEVV